MVIAGSTWPSNFIRTGKLTPAAKHLGGVGMPELMGDDAGGEAEGVADQMQVIAELNEESHFASGTRQKPSIGRQRIQGAEEAQPVDEIAAEGIDGDHALGLELAEGNMNGPLVRACGAQAVDRRDRRIRRYACRWSGATGRHFRRDRCGG